MGKLLMATEYLDAAEVCFANARELAPGEMRWPYYWDTSTGSAITPCRRRSISSRLSD